MSYSSLSRVEPVGNGPLAGHVGARRGRIGIHDHVVQNRDPCSSDTAAPSCRSSGSWPETPAAARHPRSNFHRRRHTPGSASRPHGAQRRDRMERSTAKSYRSAGFRREHDTVDPTKNCHRYEHGDAPAPVALGVLGLLASACTTQPGPDTCTQTPGNVCTVAGTGKRSFNGDGLRQRPRPGCTCRRRRVAAPTGCCTSWTSTTCACGASRRTAQIFRRSPETASTRRPSSARARRSAPLENPIDFDFLPDGRVLLAQYHDPRLLVLDTDRDAAARRGNTAAGQQGNEGDGGPATQAKFIGSPASRWRPSRHDLRRRRRREPGPRDPQRHDRDLCGQRHAELSATPGRRPARR